MGYRKSWASVLPLRNFVTIARSLIIWKTGLSEPDFLGEAVSLPYRIRSPFVALERGILRVEEHCLFLDQGNNEGIEIPVGMISSLLLEPGV